MQLRQIRLSLEPLDYSLIRYKHGEGVQALAGLITRNHTIDEDGCPRVPNMGNFHRQEAQQSVINRLARSIFSVNGATRILLRERRAKINDEIGRFRNLGLGEEERHKRAVERKEQEKPDEQKSSKVENEQKEKVGIGSGLKDLTPAQRASHEEAFRRMAEKRRAFVQAARIGPFIPTLGFAGLLMSGPQVYIPWALTTNGLGLKSPRKYDRLASLAILEADLQTTMSEFKIAMEHSIDIGSFIIFDYEDKIAAVSAIADAVSQEEFGVGDPDIEVRTRATALKDNAQEVEQLLIAHRGKRTNEGKSIFLLNCFIL